MFQALKHLLNYTHNSGLVFNVILLFLSFLICFYVVGQTSIQSQLNREMKAYRGREGKKGFVDSSYRKEQIASSQTGLKQGETTNH